MARIFQLHSTYYFQDVIRAKQSHNTWESIKTCHDAEIVTWPNGIQSLPIEKSLKFKLSTLIALIFDARTTHVFVRTAKFFLNIWWGLGEPSEEREEKKHLEFIRKQESRPSPLPTKTSFYIEQEWIIVGEVCVKLSPFLWMGWRLKRSLCNFLLLIICFFRKSIKAWSFWKRKLFPFTFELVPSAFDVMSTHRVNWRTAWLMFSCLDTSSQSN